MCIGNLKTKGNLHPTISEVQKALYIYTYEAMYVITKRCKS